MEQRKATEYTIAEKASEEGSKLYYDFFKHITTLSTGSILILVTFLERIFVSPKSKWMVGIVYGLFTLSILIALSMMASNAHSVLNLGMKDEYVRKVDFYSGAVCSICFLLGIIFLTVFAMRNLYS